MYKHVLLSLVFGLLVGCSGSSDEATEPTPENSAVSGEVQLGDSPEANKLREMGSEVADKVNDAADTIKKGAENVAEDVKQGADTMKKGLDKTVDKIQGTTNGTANAADAAAEEAAEDVTNGASE